MEPRGSSFEWRETEDADLRGRMSDPLLDGVSYSAKESCDLARISPEDILIKPIEISA
jgi:hypothetical protein